MTQEELETYKNPGTCPLRLALKYPLPRTQQTEEPDGEDQSEAQSLRKKRKTMPFAQLLTHEASLRALKDMAGEALQKVEEANRKRQEAVQKRAAREIEVKQKQEDIIRKNAERVRKKEEDLRLKEERQRVREKKQLAKQSNKENNPGDIQAN